jgi:hypothetical protein
LFGGKSKKNSEENSETSTRLSDNRHRPRLLRKRHERPCDC